MRMYDEIMHKGTRNFERWATGWTIGFLRFDSGGGWEFFSSPLSRTVLGPT